MESVFYEDTVRYVLTSSQAGPDLLRLKVDDTSAEATSLVNCTPDLRTAPLSQKGSDAATFIASN